MYTVSKKADKLINVDIEKIKDIIIKRLNPVSIILFGSFGKGEGSFISEKGKIRPLNDYDLYAITKNKIKSRILEAVGLECAQAIGCGGLEFAEHSSMPYDYKKFFHVDVRAIEYDKLKKLKPTQRTFELKHSMVVYGKDVRSLIPDVQISASDAIRLLFNKMHQLLLSKDNSKEIKAVHIYKTFLDCCSALLIIENKFASGYQERERIFLGMNFPSELKDYVKLATKWKLRADFDKSCKNLDERWDKARMWLGYSFIYITNKCLGTNSKEDEWQNVADVLYLQLPRVYFKPYLPKYFNFAFLQYYLNIRFFLTCFEKRRFLIRPLFDWRDVGLKLAIALMLYLYGKEDKSLKYLNEVTKTDKEQLRAKLLELYGLYYSQKLI